MPEKKVLIQMRDLRIGSGIATCIMNYYKYTVQHGYSIDFLLNRNVESPYIETARKYGSKILVLPCDTNKPNKQNSNYIKKVVTDKYDVFHVNISGLNALKSLKIAKKVGIKTRIYHAHNPKETSSIKARVRSALYETPSVWLANKYAACSTYAGESLFGKRPYIVLKNAMNISKYVFDEDARNRLRAEMGVDHNFVVGIVGRLAEQKNPYFAIDIFAELKKRKENAVLIWAGDGDLIDSIQDYVRDKGLEYSVKLLGTRNDTNKLYSAIDVFLLPSKFEGLGLVFIEAQIAGLLCFGSDHVPEDVEISSRMHRIDLGKSAVEWADEMLRSYNEVRTDRTEDANIAGYDIDSTEDGVVNLYK